MGINVLEEVDEYNSYSVMQPCTIMAYSNSTQTSHIRLWDNTLLCKNLSGTKNYPSYSADDLAVTQKIFTDPEGLFEVYTKTTLSVVALNLGKCRKYLTAQELQDRM